LNAAIFAAMSAQVCITAIDSSRNKYVVSLSKTGPTSAHIAIAETAVGDNSPTVNSLDVTNISVQNNTILTCYGPQIMFVRPQVQILMGNVTMTIKIAHILFNADREIFLSTTATDMVSLKTWLANSAFPTANEDDGA
jgi:hypothetical protein